MVNDDDLRLFLLMHRAIRGDLVALPRAVASLAPGDRARIDAMGEWLGFIARSIEHHHRSGSWKASYQRFSAALHAHVAKEAA